MPLKSDPMKKIMLSLSGLLLASLLLLSCKTGPKDVAKTWLTDFYHMDYDAAKKLSTEDTKNLLAQFEQLSTQVDDSSKKELAKITVNIKGAKIQDTIATVTYTTSDVPDKDQNITMVKHNDKWLVQFTKDDTMGGADDPNNGAIAPDQPMSADSSAPASAPAVGSTDTSAAKQ